MAGNEQLTFALRAINQASSVLKEVQSDLGGLGDAAERSGQQVGAFDRKLALLSLGATAGLAGLGGAAVKLAMDFESSLSQVGAIAQATQSELGGLGDAAKRIGADTAFSARQAVQAMSELAAGGTAATDIIGGAADAAVALAAAGGTSLPAAARTASTAMSVWGLSTSQLTDVVNRLAGAANSSRFGVDDMSQAIAMGGAAAATAGVDFADFAATIAATANAFSSGSDAGTSFKTFITALPGNSEQAKAAIEELGLAFYDAAGNLKDMPAIVQELHDKLGGLSEQEQTVALKVIFGNDAFRTAASLMRMTGDEYQALSDKMGATDAAGIAAQRMNNLKGDVEALKGSLETLGIAVGSQVLPALSTMAQGAAEAVNHFQQLPQSTQNLSMALTAVAAATPAVVAGVRSASEAIAEMRDNGVTSGMKVAALATGIAGLGIAADLVLQKTSGHGLVEWIFGDPRLADATAEALERIQMALKYLGPDADRVAIAMQEVLKARPSEMSLIEHHWASQGVLVRDLAGAIDAMVQSLGGTNAKYSELSAARAALTAEEQVYFDKLVNWTAQQEAMKEAAKASAIAANEALEAYRQADDEVFAAAQGTKTFSIATGEAAKSADELKASLDRLIGSFADTNPQAIALRTETAFLKEELGDLKGKGDALTESERARVAVLEAWIEKNTALSASLQENQDAIEGARQGLEKYLGAGTLDAFLSSMNAAGRGFEDQIDALRLVSSAYQAFFEGDMPRAATILDSVKAKLSAPEWASIAGKVGKDMGAALGAGLSASQPIVDAEAEALGAMAAAGLSSGENLSAARRSGEDIADAGAEGVTAAEPRLTAAAKAAMTFAGEAMAMEARLLGRRAGEDGASGAAEGFGGGASTGKLAAAARAAANALLQSFKDALGIKSPSIVMRDLVGGPIIEGLALGMMQRMPAVDEAVAASVNRMLAGYASTLPTMASLGAALTAGGGGRTFSGAGGWTPTVGGVVPPGAVGDVPRSWTGGIPSNVTNPRQWFRANNPAYAFAPDYVVDAILGQMRGNPAGAPIGITQDGAELGYAPGKTFANGLWGTANLDVARESLHLLTWEGVQRISNNVQGNDGQIPVSQYDLLAKLSTEFGMDIIDLHHRLGQQTNKLGRVPSFEEFREWLRTLPRRNSPRYSDLQGILDSARAGGTGALGEDAAWSIIQDWIDNPFINDRSLPTNGYNGVQGFQPWDGAGLGGGGVSVPGWAIQAMDPRSGIRLPGMINGGNPSGDGFVQYVVTNSFEFHFDGYLGDKDELADAITEVLDKKFAA